MLPTSPFLIHLQFKGALQDNCGGELKHTCPYLYREIEETAPQILSIVPHLLAHLVCAAIQHCDPFQLLHFLDGGIFSSRMKSIHSYRDTHDIDSH